MQFNYNNPVNICFDVNYKHELSKLALKNILLITSASFNKIGVVKELYSILDSQIVQVIDFITPNPELFFLQDLKHTLVDFDCIIALGGGSVLDSAKFLSLCNDIEVKDNVISIVGDIVKSKPIYAFPTTAGTSSELTQWATIWDKKCSIKYSLSHFMLYPKMALYDINLMQSMPRDLTISTALDALSHAVESIWNKNANPISTNYALASINIIIKDLLPLLHDLNSIALRKNIALASVYSGLAFSNTQTALAHAISYPITMKFGIPHGLACSFSIPILFECLPNCEAKDILMPLMQNINSLFISLNISTNPKDYKLDFMFIDKIFSSLNSRAKNSIFDIEMVKDVFKKHLN